MKLISGLITESVSFFRSRISKSIGSIHMATAASTLLERGHLLNDSVDPGIGTHKKTNIHNTEEIFARRRTFPTALLENLREETLLLYMRSKNMDKEGNYSKEERKQITELPKFVEESNIDFNDPFVSFSDEFFKDNLYTVSEIFLYSGRCLVSFLLFIAFFCEYVIHFGLMGIYTRRQQFRNSSKLVSYYIWDRYIHLLKVFL